MRALLFGMWTVIGVSLAVLAGPVLAQEKEPVLPEKAKKAVAAVKGDLDKRKAVGPLLVWKDEKALAKLFPEYQFVAIRFRQYPIAQPQPEDLGLPAGSVTAVKGDKIEYLKDAKALEKFFTDHQAKVKGEDDAKQALSAWLALTQEYRQDGFYRFDILPKEFAVEDSGQTIRGRAVVMQGGNGEIAVTLKFKDGKLAKVDETAKIHEGVRPICQATKLLDSDPIIRKMAERDILIMGPAAGDYLMEQRRQAGPELRDAIDRIWRLIQERGH
jgi:hypothetical protein